MMYRKVGTIYKKINAGESSQLSMAEQNRVLKDRCWDITQGEYCNNCDFECARREIKHEEVKQYV